MSKEQLVNRLLAMESHVDSQHIRTGNMSDMDWENLIEADGYFSVSSIVHNYTIRDTRIPSLYTKDAIADRMREKCQRRPDSGGENNGAAVFVYWERDEVIISLDTSGEPLSKRGYRKDGDITNIPLYLAAKTKELL